MRAKKILAVLVLVGCSGAATHVDTSTNPGGNTGHAVPVLRPLPGEFMGIAFGAGLEVVQQAARKLVCNPVAPDAVENHHALVCGQAGSPVVVVFIFEETPGGLSFVGGMYSTGYADPTAAEARYAAILQQRSEEFGKPREVNFENDPAQTEVIWADGQVVAYLLLNVADEEKLVAYTVVTTEYWGLRH